MSDVKTYVAGHKSPDTDSICSAISFANGHTSYSSMCR